MRLEDLGARHLEAIEGDAGLIRHVLRLERHHVEAFVGEQAAQAGGHDALAHVRRGSQYGEGGLHAPPCGIRRRRVERIMPWEVCPLVARRQPRRGPLRRRRRCAKVWRASTMRFSICVMADIEEIGFFSHAETLGYDSVWVTDSQMLFSDCYAVLALAAQQTRRIRLGPGVAICGTRIPPVHVAAMATLNRLAPGRLHLGVGTGNTATRTMGQPPMPIAEYARHLRVLQGLLRGQSVDYTQNGVTRAIKMLIREKKYMSLEPRIPLYVSGFGPRAMELAGEYGDGLVFAIPPRGVAPDEALNRARAGAARAGRRLPDDFHAAALVNVVL